MIIFHQGLPRSGKSYEAVKTIVDELIKGKQVFTNIEGINFHKFSQLTGIPLRLLKGDIFEIEIMEYEIDGYIEPITVDDIKVNKDALEPDFQNPFVPKQLELLTPELETVEQLENSEKKSSKIEEPPKLTYKGSEVYTRVYPVPEFTPSCPLCGMTMLIKKARDFKRHKDLAHLPNEFWGCMNFPTCKGTRERLTITKFYTTKFSGSLFQLTELDIPIIYSRVTKNSFVVIDEVQDYFPAKASPLSFPMTQFITQHGHRGINILLMGQDHQDCHNLFKRRIDKLIHFTKQDAVGMPNSYSWESYKLSVKGLVKLRSGSGKYNSKFFGLYKSHVDDSVDATNHKDDRTNILKAKFFTTYLPAFLILLCYGIYYLYSFFHPAPSTLHTENKPVQIKPTKSIQSSIKPASIHKAPAVQPIPIKNAKIVESKPKVSLSPEAQYFYDLAENNRLELTGLIEGGKDSDYKFMALVDVIDSGQLVQRFTVKELQSMGWFITRKTYGILISHGKISYIVRQRPRDNRFSRSEYIANQSVLSGNSILK